MINYSKFNQAYDEYDDLRNHEHAHASFAVCGKVETETGVIPVIHSYLEAKPLGEGKGREAFEALEFMLRQKAIQSDSAIIHIGCNIYGSRAIDHMFHKAGYEYFGEDDYGQRLYKKVFIPPSSTDKFEVNYIS